MCVSVTGQINRERMWDVHQWDVIQLHRKIKFCFLLHMNSIVETHQSRLTLARARAVLLGLPMLPPLIRFLMWRPQS